MDWPADYSGRWTLAGSSSRRGDGLHSGSSGSVRLEPSEVDGFWVQWSDSGSEGPVRLQPGQVTDTRLCTALGFDNGRRLATVEHLLAALAGCGVTQARLIVQGEEVPLLDGSAQPWVEAIAEAGLAPLAEPPTRPVVREPLTVQEGTSFVTALPSDRLRIAVGVDYPQAAIGRQLVSFTLTPEVFVREVAPARTFGFREQLEQLRAAGLIRGGSLENALVCDGDRWVNPPLRQPDEPARHKLLDLLGDLALVGLPRAQVFAFRASHTLHTRLAAALAASPSPEPIAS
ncbi:UDP-3-O-acyl-N-acetylglucosamine deacetylase [Synechococcus sp. RSCCF101]|uniref:UDP-3-O-acyl-N-acetylglucosamine deacetylase n=1 Tax=Synechococcus sp. RSCCF101 TaxID=2511069 RepID=UPI00177BF81D|nr:UDP-3-O-acyl-N-acetylglucosamine deacetylase [Synechococcus sp. RSCCF101]